MIEKGVLAIPSMFYWRGSVRILERLPALFFFPPFFRFGFILISLGKRIVIGTRSIFGTGIFPTFSQKDLGTGVR